MGAAGSGFIAGILSTRMGCWAGRQRRAAHGDARRHTDKFERAFRRSSRLTEATARPLDHSASMRRDPVALLIQQGAITVCRMLAVCDLASALTDQRNNGGARVHALA